MIVMEKRPELNVRSEFEVEAPAVDLREAELSVERTDITFHDVAGDKVRILVTVLNRGSAPSQPTPMRLESAPLGAFVPWRPLAQLLVPALEPGESRELSVDVQRPHPTALGDFNRVPPKKLMMAVNSPEQSPNQRSRQRGNGLAAILNLMRGRSADSDISGKSSLSPDIWDLARRGQTHWAGNINVFIGGKPVERHLSQALRIYPGRTNMAMFLVGGPGNRDAYSFQLEGLHRNWKTALHEVTNHASLLPDPSNAPIAETQWVESVRGLMVMLATCPPEGSEKGALEVHVTQRSSGKTAIVEFSLDASAKGAGCYFV